MNPVIGMVDSTKTLRILCIAGESGFSSIALPRCRCSACQCNGFSRTPRDLACMKIKQELFHVVIIHPIFIFDITNISTSSMSSQARWSFMRAKMGVDSMMRDVRFWWVRFLIHQHLISAEGSIQNWLIVTLTEELPVQANKATLRDTKQLRPNLQCEKRGTTVVASQSSTCRSLVIYCLMFCSLHGLVVDTN